MILSSIPSSETEFIQEYILLFGQSEFWKKRGGCFSVFVFLGCKAIVGKGIRLPRSIYVDPILHLCVRTLGEIFKSYEASHRVYFVQYSVAVNDNSCWNSFKAHICYRLNYLGKSRPEKIFILIFPTASLQSLAEKMTFFTKQVPLNKSYWVIF